MKLTKIEKEKLEALKEEIVLGFRLRVMPRFYRADGSSQPIEAARRSRIRVVTKMDRLKLVAQARSLLRMQRVGQYRGVSWMVFMENMMSDMAVGAGILERVMRGIEASSDRSITNRPACRCINCLINSGEISIAGEGNSTRPRVTLFVGDPNSRTVMLPDVQLHGPLRRPMRREDGIGGYGAVMDTEPGQDRSFRRPGNEFLIGALEQAERNREMQYDERDWEI